MCSCQEGGRSQLYRDRSSWAQRPFPISLYLFIWKFICIVCISLPQCRRPGFNPWVRKIPWRRKWQPTPVFLPGESHWQRSLESYSPQGCKESKRLSNSLSLFTFNLKIGRLTLKIGRLVSGWGWPDHMSPLRLSLEVKDIRPKILSTKRVWHEIAFQKWLTWTNRKG